MSNTLTEYLIAAGSVGVSLSGPLLWIYLWGLRGQLDRIEGRLRRIAEVGDDQHARLTRDVAALRSQTRGGWTWRMLRHLRGLPVLP